MVSRDQIEKLIEQCDAGSCQRTPKGWHCVETLQTHEEIPEIRRDLFTSDEMSHPIEGARDTKSLPASETREIRSQELSTPESAATNPAGNDWMLFHALAKLLVVAVATRFSVGGWSFASDRLLKQNIAVATVLLLRFHLHQ